MWAAASDYLTPILPRSHPAGEGVLRVDNQVLPQGAVPGVRAVLEDLGYRVEVRDHRQDSERWALDPCWRERVAEEYRGVVGAVGAHAGVRVVMPGEDRVADAVAGVAGAYPAARVAVAVPTYALLDCIAPRLKCRLAEPLGLYTARKRRPGRVAVGLVRQFPLGKRGDWDLLVLPHAESTVGDEALRVATSGQYRRILSFTPRRWTRDENVNQRLTVLAGHVWPSEREVVPVTAVVLDAHGTRPKQQTLNAFEEKVELYWRNGRRNRRVAEVARCLARRGRKSVRSVVGGGPLVGEVLGAAEGSVAVLVESLDHARELARLLPGWAVWSGNDLTVEKPALGCGVIATERAAQVFVIGAGVLIRATGTRWGLPQINWPWVGGVGRGVLIDFADQYHPLAARNATLRVTEYEESGRIGAVVRAETITTNHRDATGASG
jgi:hypothetical protein